jgi:hypothetical protein
MNVWFVINAWHIAMFKFERMVTKLLFIRFTFLSRALKN